MTRKRFENNYQYNSSLDFTIGLMNKMDAAYRLLFIEDLQNNYCNHCGCSIPDLKDYRMCQSCEEAGK